MSRRLFQGAAFALFAALIAYFSAAPPYRHFAPGQAMIKVSFSHAGEIVGECHTRSAEELNRLSRNMRALQACPRERSPVTVEIELDGRLLYRETLEPKGLARDGAVSIYRRLPVAAGAHRMTVRMNDSVKTGGFAYRRSETLTLRPQQTVVIDFSREKGGIVFNRMGAEG